MNKLLPKKVNKITIYLMALLVITLGGLSLKGTYAKFTSNYTTPDNIVGINLSFNLDISNIEEYEEIHIKPNSYEIFNVKLTNDSSETAYYGIWYKMVNPTFKTSDITIARNIENETATSGSILENSDITASIIIKNNTNSSVIVNIGVASSNKSIEDIEYLNGKVLINGTTSEVDFSYDSINKRYISYEEGNSNFTLSSLIYSYTGLSQTFTSDHTGVYQVEAWGAEIVNTKGETLKYGEYSRGNIILNNKEKVYLTIGSKSSTSNDIKNDDYIGKRASYITKDDKISSLTNENLNKILILASNSAQTSSDKFGYIGNELLHNKIMYCYNCQINQDRSNLIFNTTNKSNTPTTNYAKQGNGAIKITPIAPTVTITQSINPGEQIENNQLICNDNGSGCEIYKIQDTTKLDIGEHPIKVILKDSFGYTYKYMINLKVENKISQEFKVVYDSKAISLYSEDNNLLKSTPLGNTTIKNIERMNNYIGKPTSDTEKYFKGYIYKIKITLKDETPLLEYDFTKNTTRDLSGNGYNGILQNGANLKYDGKRYALFLDGVDDYLQIPSLPSTIDFASGYTIEIEATWSDTNNKYKLVNLGNDTIKNNISIYSTEKNLCAELFDNNNSSKVLSENYLITEE